MIITHNTYQLPIKLPRNEYGASTNTSFIISSNDLFSNTASPSSSENGGSSYSGDGSYIPDFIGATSYYDGVRGIVPAPRAGQEDYYLHGDGTWNEIPVMTASTASLAGSKGLAPAPPAGSQDLFLTGSGEYKFVPVMIGATSSEAGYMGLAPTPDIGENTKFLKGDGTWADVPVMIGATPLTAGYKGLAPTPDIGENNKYLKGDGTWADVPVMIGATVLTSGEKGLVPKPAAGTQDKYLTGAGTWERPTVFVPATTTNDGVQGEVPGPLMGQIDNYLLEATGNWEFDPAHKWLKEFPDQQGLEPSGLTIDGDFNVQSPHTLSTFNLEVEGRAHFWELVIDRVKANGGQLLVSPSNFKVDDIGPTIIYYINEEPIASILNYRPDIKRALQKVNAVAIKCQRVFMRNDDGDNTIVPSVNIGDMLRCKSFNIGPGEYNDISNKDYWTFVLGVGSEQYKEVPEGYDEGYGTANFIDLAYYILTDQDALPIDSMINDDGTVDIPEDFDPQYEIADLKDISRQVMDGEHDRMEEFPDQREMDQITIAVLDLPDIPIPEELIDVDDYISHYEPVIHNDPVSGATTWDDPAYADELSKYNTDPLYANWQFGYGKIEVSIGDELACLGHLFDVDRRNAIVLSSVTPIDPELVAPSIAQYNGIDIFGLSISKFRLNTIAKNGNYFYGWFGVESGSGSYLDVRDVITTSVQSARDDAYSYTMQTYNMLYSYVTDSNAYSYAYTKLTYDSLTTFIDSEIAGAKTYSYQTAYGFYQSAYNSYLTTWSFVEQTDSNIRSLVANTKQDTYTYAYQTAYGFYQTAYNSYKDTWSFIQQTDEAIRSYVGNEIVGAKTYSYQTAYGFYQSAYNSYLTTWSFVEQTDEAIRSYVGNEIAGANTYAYQTAYGFYREAYNGYTYTLSYIAQTANGITSYVYDSYAYTLSFINQTADRLSSSVQDAYNGLYSYITQEAGKISSYVYDSYAYTLSFINQTADSISSSVQDAYNGLYSYITQEAGKISSYVIDSYAYTLSFINQTASSITSSVQDGYNGLYSYITQEAGKISSYVVDSYAYTLSFTQQTASSISSTVQNLSTYTYSNINQLSDRIDLSVSKDELEVVGIHIDGQESTVNIVGSLAVKQNGDGDVDTIKVYDEDNILRVEVSPTDIPSKDDLDIESVSISLVNDYLWTNRKNASGRHVQYTSSWNIGATIHTGDIITLLNPAFSLSLAPRENSTWGAAGWIDSWACYFRVETTDGRQIINESLSGSGVPTAYLMNDSAKTVKFYKSGTFTSGQLSNNFNNKQLRVVFLIDIGFTSAVSNPINWTIDAYDTSGTLRYTKAGGVDPTSMMKIGQNGFYYTYSGNYHLYNGTDGFEVNNNGNKVSVTDEDVKICRTAYFTNESILVIGEGDPDTDSSIIVTTATNFISAETAQLIVLYDTGLYGLGRELVIVGYRGLGIKTSKDPIWISSEMTNNGRVDKKLIYEANNSSNAGLLILGDRDVDYISSLGIYMINSNGTLRLIALSDGWHVLQ